VGLPDATFSALRVGSFVTLDTRAAYRIAPNLTVSLIGRSITMSNQRQTSIATVDRRLLTMLQATF